MPISEARKRANEKYNKKAYDRIELKVKKGDKEKIQVYAQKQGLSLNAFIYKSVLHEMGINADVKKEQKPLRKKDISVELL